MRQDGIIFDESLDYRPAMPEYRLLAAILNRAVSDAIRGEERKAALLWLLCKDEYIPFDDERSGFTFLEICEALDLNPALLLRNVHSLMRESDIRKEAQLRAVIEEINNPVGAVA